jgi:hypothetical protein
MFRNSFLPHAALGLVISLLVCSTAQAELRLVKESDVSACRFLSQVSGNSGYGKNNDWKGIAKYAALRQAEKLGASDIVVDRYTPVGAFNGQVEARAYVCGQATTKTAAQTGE